MSRQWDRLFGWVKKIFGLAEFWGGDTGAETDTAIKRRSDRGPVRLFLRALRLDAADGLPDGYAHCTWTPGRSGRRKTEAFPAALHPSATELLYFKG